MGGSASGRAAYAALRPLRRYALLTIAAVIALLVPAQPLVAPMRVLASSYSSAILSDSPKVYYRLNETGCCTAADSSGSSYTGTYTASGITYSVSGALASDTDAAITSSATVAAVSRDDTFLPSGNAARSVELWEKTSTAGTYGLLSYGTTTTNAYFGFNLNGSSQISMDGWTNYVIGSTPYSVEDGNWHYLAGTYDGTNVRLYVDGQQVVGGTLSMSTVVPGQGLWVGNGQDGGAHFPGSLDDVAIYGSALTATQINAHWRAGVAAAACPAASPTGYAGTIESDSPSRYFRLGETSSRWAMDAASSTSCRPAAYNAGATHGPGGVIGDTDGSAGSPMTAATIVAGSGDGLPTGARTVELWEKTSSTGTFGLLSYGTAATNQYLALNLNSATSMSLDAWGNYVLTNTPKSVEDGTWHYLAATDDSSGNIALYLDGSLIATGTLSLATSLPGQGLWLGADQDGGSPFPGSLDEVAIYPAALSAARILAHYNAGVPVGGPVTASQTAGGCNCDVANGNVHSSVTPSPIDTATGNFWHTFTDLSIPGRSYPLAFTRTYNSQSAGTNGPLGYGWQFNQSMSLSQNGSTVTITQENGSQATFTQSGSTWVPSAPRFIATLTHNGDGTWTFVRNHRDTYGFNSAGQLTSATDLNGYTTTLGYTGGHLTTITDPAGRALTLGWTGSTITSLSDGNVSPARTVSFQYNDGAGNLTDAFDVNNGHWQFSYDANHRMTVMKDPKCYATSGCPGIQNSYDGSGRVQWQKDQLNRQTSFTYNTDGSSLVSDPKGNQQLDVYNQGLRVATTRGYGTSQAATWRYAYDTISLALVAVTDPNGNKTTDTVDSSGNPLTITDPLGRQTVNTYNAFNEILTTKDPNTVTTTSTYDANGNLTSVSRPLTGTSQVQTTTYNHADSSHPGDVTSMVDPDNKTWLYGYDTNGYRNSVQDPLGDTATSVFNNDGWITASVSPKGNVSGCGCASQYTTSDSYNAFGQLTTVTDPLGHQTIRHYDVDQNLDWFQDGDGNRTIYVYDLANQQTQIQRPDTTTLTTDYNADGTVQDQKDGKNNAIQTYGYDALGRVTSQTDAIGNVTSFSYDGAGNQLTKQDPGGNCTASPKTGCTSFTYDTANELKAITYSDGVTPNVTNITYDADGQRTGMTDGSGTSAWVWDSLHRLTSYTNGNGAQIAYAYNLRNLPTTITYPGNLNVTRGYDGAGRFSSVQDWLSNSTTFGYDADSNLTTETLPSGSSIVDTFTFDAADRLMAISDVKGGSSTLFAATYTRDSANQLTSDSSAPSASGSYKYTTLNQVCYAGSSSSNACGSPPTGATSYGYDASGNLTQMGATQQAFNNADQLCWTAAISGSCASPPSGATTFGYDTRGNRTQIAPPGGGATNLSYDQADRLTAYGSAATYAYNGDGLRMSKTVSGNTNQFLWDTAGNLPVLVKDGSTDYVYGPANLPLEQITGSTVLWFHHDLLGSTRLVSDSTGANQATYTFDAYGKLIGGTGTIPNPLKYAGQYQDPESLLYYLRARYYDPSTAQFLTVDPEVAATGAPYSYAGGNPVTSSDPTGLDNSYYYSWDLGPATSTRNPQATLWWLTHRADYEFPFSFHNLPADGYTVHAPGVISDVGDTTGVLCQGNMYAISMFGTTNPIRVDYAGMQGNVAVLQFTALPGHVEGTGSVIRFSSWIDRNGHQRFDVTGHDTYDYAGMPVAALQDVSVGFVTHAVDLFEIQNLWNQLASNVNGGRRPSG